MNSNPDRPMSSNQPKALQDVKRVEMIKWYLANKMEDEARMLDERFKLGYFAKIEEDARPLLEKHLNLFITQDPEMLRLKDKIKILAREDDPVLLIGESGSGKELLANALHGNKNEASFISLNCAGLPEYLIESELFGHKKGSFTGADKDKEGMFRAADNGTLFLDEIGELPLGVQAKLLRALQERAIRMVGSNKEESISCRFVAATHHDLSEQVKLGKFRLDLYYRLATFELRLTGLCKRPNDIPLIVASLDQGDKKFPAEQYDWELMCSVGLLNGNVRAIQQMVRRWQVFGELPAKGFLNK